MRDIDDDHQARGGAENAECPQEINHFLIITEKGKRGKVYVVGGAGDVAKGRLEPREGAEVVDETPAL